MNISLFAHSKILSKTQLDGAIRISIQNYVSAGDVIDLVFGSKELNGDVIIWTMPKIVASQETESFLKNQCLDYDSDRDQFIISCRGKS